MKQDRDSSAGVQFGKAAAVVTGLGCLGLLIILLFVLKYWPVPNNASSLLNFGVIAILGFCLLLFSVFGIASGTVASAMHPSWLTISGLICSAASLLVLVGLWNGVIKIKPENALVHVMEKREEQTRATERQASHSRALQERQRSAEAATNKRIAAVTAMIHPASTGAARLALDPHSASLVRLAIQPTRPPGQSHRVQAPSPIEVPLKDLQVDGRITLSPDAQPFLDVTIVGWDFWAAEASQGSEESRSTLTTRFQGALNDKLHVDRILEIRASNIAGIITQDFSNGESRKLTLTNANFHWWMEGQRHGQLEFDLEASPSRPALRYVIPLAVSQPGE